MSQPQREDKPWAYMRDGKRIIDPDARLQAIEESGHIEEVLDELEECHSDPAYIQFMEKHDLSLQCLARLFRLLHLLPSRR